MTQQGALLLAAALAVQAIGFRPASVESARAQALIAFTVGNLGLVWRNASSGGAVVPAGGMLALEQSQSNRPPAA